MRIDIKLLEDKIFEKRQTKSAVARACGVDISTFRRRLDNGTLTVKDVHNIVSFLCLSNDEAIRIFLSE